MFEVNALAVLALVAGAQSLVFDYFPYVATWFDALADHQKRQLTAGLGVFFAIAIFALSCQGYWFQTDLVCEPQSLVTLAGNIILSVGSGYAFHKQTKPNEALKDKLGIGT